MSVPNYIKKSVFSVIWRNYEICLTFLWRKHGKFKYQYGWYRNCMETVWRKILNGMINLEIVRGFNGEYVVKQITRQSPY